MNEVEKGWVERKEEEEEEVKGNRENVDRENNWNKEAGIENSRLQ